MPWGRGHGLAAWIVLRLCVSGAKRWLALAVDCAKGGFWCCSRGCRGQSTNQPMGRDVARATNGNTSKDEAQDDADKWNDDGAVGEKEAGEPNFWRNETMLLAGTALVLLIDVLSVASILTAIEENDRATGT